MRRRRPNFIVGIGGSAGGLNAYKALIDAVPANTGMAFVIVSHIVPTANSWLAHILSRHTAMTVMVAATAMPIWANHVYVCPPNADLLIETKSLNGNKTASNGFNPYSFKVVSPRSRRNAQVDLFLASLASAMGSRAVGVILSGYDGDGTEGCRLIKAQGGTTFAQDHTAEVNGMSLSAQAAGCVDFVLPPGKMPIELKQLGNVKRSKGAVASTLKQSKPATR